MTSVHPTTTVSVLRGETLDEFGDPVDSDSSVRAGVPIAITEYSRRIFVAAEQRMTVVRQCWGRVRPGFDIREKDRLRDERTGRIYLVEEISQPALSTNLADMRISLRRIDS